MILVTINLMSIFSPGERIGDELSEVTWQRSRSRTSSRRQGEDAAGGAVPAAGRATARARSAIRHQHAIPPQPLQEVSQRILL